MSAKNNFENKAKNLMELVSTLSLFTRITMNDWLPSLFTEIKLTEERYIAMYELNLQPDISLKKLSQNLMVAPSNLSVMINSMVEQGLVLRVPDPDDRRKVLLRLSEKGIETCKKADKFILDQFGVFIHKLPAEDQEELNLATEKMIKIAKKIIERQAKSK